MTNTDSPRVKEKVRRTRAKARPLPKIHTVSVPGLNVDYCFTLASNITEQIVGETQGGYRIDLAYSGGDNSVAIKDASDLGDDARKYLIGASIASGSDWAFVSQAGVVDFDSRITIVLRSDAEQRCLLAARLRGRADLRDCIRAGGVHVFKQNAINDDVIQLWKSGGFDNGTRLPLILSIVFDVPDEGFAPDQTEVYKECSELGRSLFTGVGYASFLKGSVRAIELDLHRVTGSSGAGGSTT